MYNQQNVTLERRKETIAHMGYVNEESYYDQELIYRKYPFHCKRIAKNNTVVTD